MIVGGAVAAYLIWDKFIKEDKSTSTGDSSFDGYDYARGSAYSSKTFGFKKCHCGGTQGDEKLCTGSCKDCCINRRRRKLGKA